MFKRFSYGSLSLSFSLSVLLLNGCGGGSSSSADGNFSIDTTTATVALGRKLFFDTDLSSNNNQSCATCHDPVSGFADDRVTKAAPVSEGSLAGSFGNRNAPTAAYATFSPAFGLVVDQAGETNSKYRGGQFLDGRRSNLFLQAKDPFLNPLEMNNNSAAAVVAKVSNATYATDFLSLFGSGAFDNSTTAYDNIALAIAAFEASSELNPFTSKYDAYLGGQYTLSAAEQRGLDLFKDANGGAKCANCHTLDDTVGSDSQDSLFTNFEYYNVGTPVNPGTPTSLAIDNGLGGGDNLVVATAGDLTTERGKFKVPTLRNVELTAPYMHNGVYATLDEVITHYDIQVANAFITPEVNANIANELANPLNLQPTPTDDKADLIAFLLTLTDGYL